MRLMIYKKQSEQMKILVSGSDGYSGSNYCTQAREKGHEILGVDIDPWFKPQGCEIQRLDIRDGEACLAVCRNFKPDAIIHTARAPGNLGQIEKDRATAYRRDRRRQRDDPALSREPPPRRDEPGRGAPAADPGF